MFSLYWWRYDLENALLEQGLNDGVEHIKKHVNIDVKPLDENGEEQVFCMVTEKPYSLHSINETPDGSLRGRPSKDR